MTRFRKEIEQEDGWSQEVAPKMLGYKMACCDCGLVHDMDFKVVKVTQINDDGSWESENVDGDYRVIFKARRNNRSTGQVRRHK